MYTDRCDNTRRQKCRAKASVKEGKIQEFMYRYATNVEPEMYDCTSNNWSHWDSNEKLKEKFGNYTRKTFDRFITKHSYTWNITHNTESTRGCKFIEICLYDATLSFRLTISLQWEHKCSYLCDVVCEVTINPVRQKAKRAMWIRKTN